MGPTQGERASPLFGKGRQALVGDISADETEREEGGGARRVVVIDRVAGGGITASRPPKNRT
jgi:hypothetical protein